MKSIIVGIICGVLLLGVVILFPVQIGIAQEIIETSQIERELVHPCQKLVLRNLELTLQNPYEIFADMDTLEISKLQKEYNNEYDKIRQMSIDNNCVNIDDPTQMPNWYDEEFQQKVREKMFELTGSYPDW